MGQKTHPTGFRIGVNKAHSSTWFANYGAFSEVLKEDFQYVNFLKKNSVQFIAKLVLLS